MICTIGKYCRRVWYRQIGCRAGRFLFLALCLLLPGRADGAQPYEPVVQDELDQTWRWQI